MFIKICGCRRVEDVTAAAGAGAAAVGMILVPGRRRSVDTDEARALRAAVPPEMWAVGVFLDQPLADVLRLVDALRLDAAQLHGTESADYCAEVRRVCRVIKAWNGQGEAPTDADLVLVEPSAGRSGGHGVAWDWASVKALAVDVPVILSGGLDPENVQAACVAARPWGVDTSSGVEWAGVKSRDRIVAFCDAARRWQEMSEESQALATSGMAEAFSGRFGRFGGQYVPETVMPALTELEAAFRQALVDPAYHRELDRLLRDYVGRPTPLWPAVRLAARLPGGVRCYLKREDLCHTGAHKINNALGQALLAQRMGKRRLIAETGAGQHGVATATAAALLGFSCAVYMGEEDMERQALNVFRMRLLGAEVVPVGTGGRTLKDALNEAIRDWVTTVEHTHYVLGTAAGMHPYPWIVRALQSVIGREARRQVLEAEGRLPDAAVACVGGGSNAIGLFAPFLEDTAVRLIGVEAAGEGLASGRHAATLTAGRPGVLHGSLSYVLQDDDGQVLNAHSISAGLDYPGVGPEHSYLKDSGRATYLACTDAQALDGMRLLAETEGIIPALESAHAIGLLPEICERLPVGAVVVVSVSGRGDKDMPQVARLLGKGGKP